MQAEGFMVSFSSMRRDPSFFVILGHIWLEDLSVDRRGPIEEIITCLGRDEDACVDVNESSRKQQNCRQTSGDCHLRGRVDLDFTAIFRKDGSNLAD